MNKDTKMRILVPVDFTNQSRLALDHSQKIARHIGAEITLLNVINQDKNTPNIITAKENPKEIEGKLHEFGRACNLGKRFNTLIGEGIIPTNIVSSAKSIDASFIVMGAYRQKKTKKSAIASGNALQVIKESAIPVITINGDINKEKFENIILPLDLSNVTTQKVTLAIQLARLGKGGTIIKLVSVVFTMDDYLLNRLTRLMEDVKSTIKSKGVECTAEIIKANKDEESIGEVILDYSRKMEGDLIVIMTNQDSKSKKKIVDSDAEEIITTSEIPVLSIIPATE